MSSNFGASRLNKYPKFWFSIQFKFRKSSEFIHIESIGRTLTISAHGSCSTHFFFFFLVITLFHVSHLAENAGHHSSIDSCSCVSFIFSSQFLIFQAHFPKLFLSHSLVHKKCFKNFCFHYFLLFPFCALLNEH